MQNKTFREKVVLVLSKIIGISLFICLFGGGLGFFGFLSAFFFTQETSIKICTWVFEVYYDFLIKLSTITTIITFIYMYFNKDAKWINPVKYWKSKMMK